MNQTEKLTHKEFVLRALKALAKPPYKGIHVVYSGFNEAFRQYYGAEPRPVIDAMVDEGFLASHVARGGAIIMLATEEGKKHREDRECDAALTKILSQD